MQQAGAYVKEEVCRALIVLISNAPELHGYTARSMYRALKDSADQAELTLSLVTSTCWFLGEPAHSCLSFQMTLSAVGQVQVCNFRQVPSFVWCPVYVRQLLIVQRHESQTHCMGISKN